MKYGPRIYPSEIIETKKHWAVGTTWHVQGSDMYAIEMHNNGFSCNCPSYKKCKHIKQIEEKVSDDSLVKTLYKLEMAEINSGRY